MLVSIPDRSVELDDNPDYLANYGGKGGIITMASRDLPEAQLSRDNDPVPSLFGHYELDAQFFDETFESEEQPRAHYRLLIDEMERMSQEEVTRLQERVTRSFLHEGITFTVYGDEESIERVIPSIASPASCSPESGSISSVGSFSVSRR